MGNYYPPVGFHFEVEFLGIDNFNHDNQFQSVSGLTIDLETEEIAEGGQNHFKHKLPVRTSFSNLVLTRGMLKNSGVIAWVKAALEGFQIVPINLTVKLLDENHEPLQTWSIVNAYPVQWSIGDFNAEESSLVIETLELTYNYFKII